MRQILFGLVVLCYACSSPEFTIWNTVRSDAKVVLEVSQPPLFLDDSLLQSVKSIRDPGQPVLISLFSDKGRQSLVAHIAVREKNFRDWIKVVSGGGGFTAEKKEEIELFELKPGNQKWYLAYKAPVLLISENTPVGSMMAISAENLFKIKHNQLFHFATTSDSGTVYVNDLPLSDFRLPEGLKKIKCLENQEFSAALDLKTSGLSLSLTGFSPYPKNKLPISGQRPVASQIWPMIPEDTRLFIQFGISDIFTFAGLKKDTSRIENYLSSEIAYCSFSNSPDDFVLILKSSNAAKLHSLIAGAGDKELQAENMDALRDNFEIPWLKNFLPPMNLKYVWRHDPWLFLAAGHEALIKAKEDVDSDATWGKSHNFLHFNKRHLQAANCTVIVKEGDSDTTKTIFSPLFADRTARMSSFQWSTLDDSYYTNINIELGDAALTPVPHVKTISISEVINYTPVFNKAFDNVQVFIEGKRLLTLRNMEQKILWGRPLDDVRTGDFTNVDFYRNGKWQFFYATPSALFVVDRLGRTVSDYPIDLPFKASFARVVDYDNSRRYRWMAGGGKEIYLYNKSGKTLPGWNPRIMEDTILCSPQHFRDAHTHIDYFIVPLISGEVHLLRRTGKEAVHFPVTLAPVLPHYVIEPDERSLYFITSQGELFTLSLDGKKSSVRLPIPEGALITPVSAEAYYVAQNAKSIAAFKKANKLFETGNPLGSTSEAGWFRANGKMYFTFFDKFKKLCYVVNDKGKPATGSPFQTQLPLKGIEANGQSYVFKVSDNKVTRVTME